MSLLRETLCFLGICCTLLFAVTMAFAVCEFGLLVTVDRHAREAAAAGSVDQTRTRTGPAIVPPSDRIIFAAMGGDTRPSQLDRREQLAAAISPTDNAGDEPTITDIRYAESRAQLLSRMKQLDIENKQQLAQSDRMYKRQTALMDAARREQAARRRRSAASSIPRSFTVPGIRSFSGGRGGRPRRR